MNKKQKYYVVWKGRNPGVYNDWETTKENIQGFEGAQYKAFESLPEAQIAIKSNYYNYVKNNSSEKKIVIEKKINSSINIITNSISVDAACAGNPGDMEYRGVKTINGEQIFHMGPYKMGTNNVGEFLAIVHAAALLKKNGFNDTVIYTDSKTAMAWIRNKHPKTNLKKIKQNEPIFELLERAVVWLQNNIIENKIIHWDTPNWGEIPADFGRK